MKEKIKIIVVLLIIGAVFYFGYQYYKKETPREGEEIQKIESQREIVIRNLTEKYDALAGWNKDIYYTIQLQNLLVDSDKLVLFTADVDDIFIKDDQYYVRFITPEFWGWTASESEVYFVLKCDLDKAIELLSNKEAEDNLFSDNYYVVIAQIESVTKPMLQITGFSGYESEEVELEYEPSSVFVATGNFIDFIYIEKE